ncbi:histidine--tRNA ligase [Allorhodopirellula heiligendammensis]|uniref:Histidine--tRNA ligase n=1 Tax=Allorhodopirellula heiligendammensis TaxID=2714739 RepID=A0A5C6BDT6_9BACT|nr:histidine--tRNA ligase [Allorhodopirellula heiligendammensis]TWU08594.1 Histidine--tRNA ligase [Allorhodopirellula heiligendammensis]
MPLIQPRTLKGFRDYLPAAMIPRERIMETARQTFRSFGFAPIDTPTLEHLEILTGKGSEETDRQLYQFIDAGKRPVGMRFDLTVPLARFAAQHIGQLGTPFKRYQIAPVWRGENPQAGRYREFYQCDFDTIGTQSVLADIEAVTVIDALLRAIGIDAFTISINNRAILSGLLESLGLADKTTPILRSLDKLGKIGRELTAKEMVESAGITAEQSEQVLRLAECDGSADEVFAMLPSIIGDNQTAQDGATRLREIYEGAVASGVSPDRMTIDVSIARGLDYYTGVIFETTLDELPSIGSVCSGGRYDNLAGLYTKEHLPGIGASLGLDRLLAALETLQRLSSTSKPCPVFIPYFDKDHRDDYLRLATNLRRVGIGTEVYPEPRKLKAQLKYADAHGFAYAIIAGGDEWAGNRVQIKTLAEKTSQDIEYTHDAPEKLIAQLSSAGPASTL